MNINIKRSFTKRATTALFAAAVGTTTLRTAAFRTATTTTRTTATTTWVSGWFWFLFQLTGGRIASTEQADVLFPEIYGTKTRRCRQGGNISNHQMKVLPPFFCFFFIYQNKKGIWNQPLTN
jgi:hypothetical protein